MNDEQRLDDALRALAAAGVSESAPAAVELALRAAFRKRVAARRPAWALPLGIAAAAGATALALVASLAIRTPPRKTPPPAPVARQVEPPATLAPQPATAPKPARVAASRPRVTRRPARAEVTTPFVPLAESAGEPSQLVRVRMPRAALRSFGFPINEDRAAERISADVLLGEDGTALAIRLVR